MRIIFLFCIFASLITRASWVDETLASMSIEQKIGQLFIAASNTTLEYREKGSVTFFDIDEKYLQHIIGTYHIGGVMFLGKRTALEHYTITQQLQQNNSIPLLIALDAEWGLGMRLSDCIEFPHAMTLGALHNNDLIYAMGLEIGRQCTIMGIHINCCPVADVNTDPDNPIIGTRAFGNNPSIVGTKATALARGLHDAGIIACAKHFPGHGNTHADSHEVLPVITSRRHQLDTIELVPFKQLIEAGIPAIMIGHLAVPSLERDTTKPASLSHAIAHDLLRTQMGFKGLIITDSLLHMKSATEYAEQGKLELLALLAGNDILLCPTNIPAAVLAIKDALESGKLSEHELDAHVQRILAAKEWIFREQKHYSVAPTKSNDLSMLHTPAAYLLQEQLYEKAMTCVYDREGLLPLKADTLYYLIPPEKEKAAYFVQLLTNALPHIEAKEPESLEHIPSSVPIIVPIMGTAQYRQSLSDESAILIQKIIAQGNPLILVLCTSAYILTKLPQADACIIAYEGSIEAQQAAIRALTGTIVPCGILPLTI
jgi:beta-N-acetylhexosaminidase